MNDDLYEKVIKGLECCAGCSGDECKKCPYNDECLNTDIPCGMSHLAADALFLLKAQEPHVMTPEEVEKVEEQGVVWCEYKEGNHFPAIVEPFIRCGNIFENPGGYILLMEVTDCDDYLKYYRFWNAKPTDEQREAVKWDE